MVLQLSGDFYKIAYSNITVVRATIAAINMEVKTSLIRALLHIRKIFRFYESSLDIDGIE